VNDIHFYIDDSGTRHPDKKQAPEDRAVGDWFALGGVLLNSEDEQQLRDLHSAFCESWGIDYPLHSADIRFQKENFEWLKELDKLGEDRFFSELEQLIISAPVVGLACVIDRPGYNARYREKYGRQRWSLCKTTFSVIAERSAKRAIAEGRRLRIYPERSDPDAESKLRGYYRELREIGMPFHEGGDPKYRPLGQPELNRTLREFKLKFKSSPPMQIADLYLYPICRAGYVKYKPIEKLRANRKLIDDLLPPDDVDALGIKYSCFELVRSKGG
jgi:hypothetical protein